MFTHLVTHLTPRLALFTPVRPWLCAIGAATLLSTPGAFAQTLAAGTQQIEQGTIEVDTGKGFVKYVSLATKHPEDLGQQVAQRLQTDEGQAAVEQGEKRVSQVAGAPSGQVASAVQSIANRYAGTTTYASELTEFKRLPQLKTTFELNGTATDGASVRLSVRFDPKTLQVEHTQLQYAPQDRGIFDNYQADKNSIQVTLDKFEQNGELYAIAGSFEAKSVPPNERAKKLGPEPLPYIKGRFALDQVPLKFQ